MVLHILKATIDDVPTLIDIYFAAFQNPMALAAFPDVPTVRKWWTEMIAEEIEDPDVIIFKAVEKQENAVGDEGTIVAWAEWNKPTDKKEDIDLPDWPVGSDSKVAQDFFSQAEEITKRLMKGPYWCMSL
jgi:hypothetical protein